MGRNEDTLSEIRDVTISAVNRGSELARNRFRGPNDSRHKTGKMDPVTQTDIDVQQRVVDTLTGFKPDATIVGEEGDATKYIPEDGTAWVIDPIDGTNNFVRGNRLWAVAISHLVDSKPRVSVIRLPAVGDTYLGTEGLVQRNEIERTVSERSDPETLLAAPIFGLKRKGRNAYRNVTGFVHDQLGDVRRYGSGQAALAMLACGEIDVAISTVSLTPWDTVAGAHLVREAGGRVTDLDGNAWQHDSDSLVASNGCCHDELLERLHDALPELF